MRVRHGSSVWCATMLIALCGVASAGERGGECPPPLSGPGVRDRDVPGAANRFDQGPREPGEKATPRVAPRVFFDALRSLDDEEAPAEVRPTDAQREEFRAIVDEFRAEARSMQERRREGEGPGERRRGRGDRPPPPREEERGEARAERMPPPPPMPPPDRGPEGARGPRPDGPPPPDAGERRRGPGTQRGPNPDGYYARVWEMLNEDQQEFLRDRIDEARRERMMEREAPIVREGARERRRPRPE